MLILCVEDENFLRTDIVEELIIAGYDVVEACNGEQALEQVAARNPDLILTDISMPCMNGYDLLAKLRSDEHKHHNAPVIFMTAFDETDVALRCSARPDAIIRKPVDYGDLIAVLKTFDSAKATSTHSNRQG